MTVYYLITDEQLDRIYEGDDLDLNELMDEICNQYLTESYDTIDQLRDRLREDYDD